MQDWMWWLKTCLDFQNDGRQADGLMKFAYWSLRLCMWTLFNAVFCLELCLTFQECFLKGSSCCLVHVSARRWYRIWPMTRQTRVAGGGRINSSCAADEMPGDETVDLFWNMCLMFNGLASFIAFRLERWNDDWWPVSTETLTGVCVCVRGGARSDGGKHWW